MWTIIGMCKTAQPTVVTYRPTTKRATQSNASFPAGRNLYTTLVGPTAFLSARSSRKARRIRGAVVYVTVKVVSCGHGPTATTTAPHCGEKFFFYANASSLLSTHLKVHYELEPNVVVRVDWLLSDAGSSRHYVSASNSKMKLLPFI